MRRVVVAVAITLALAVSAIGALPVFASTGRGGHSGCVFNTPSGPDLLPAQACQHRPTFWGSTCILITDEEQMLELPWQACAYGPQPVANGSQPQPAASGCAVDTPRGAIGVPAQVCAHVPMRRGSRCILITYDEQALTLPMQACEHGPRPAYGP